MTPVINEDNCHIWLQKSNSHAYHYLIRIYFPVLCHFVERIINDNSQSAEDIVTESFLKLWERRSQFDSFDHIRKFLYVSAKNACLNYLRSRQREKSRHEVFSQNYWVSDDTLFEEVIHAELLASVREAIDALPPKMREIFILSYIRQMSNQEISEKLKISNQTVRNQKAKALSALKNMLQHISVSKIMAIAMILHVR